VKSLKLPVNKIRKGGGNFNHENPEGEGQRALRKRKKGTTSSKAEKGECRNQTQKKNSQEKGPQTRTKGAGSCESCFLQMSRGGKKKRTKNWQIEKGPRLAKKEPNQPAKRRKNKPRKKIHDPKR